MSISRIPREAFSMMQYSTLHFFRRTPTALLHRYFQERHGLLTDLDFGGASRVVAETIFKAFLTLPEPLQAVIESELREVHAMACAAGASALADEADFDGDQAFIETLATLEGYHARAMWALLTKPHYWRAATHFLRSDSFPAAAWKKRIHLPKAAADVSAAGRQALETAISG
jgi:hypothetical protein